jgi:SAM-dependent methyltransferase
MTALPPEIVAAALERYVSADRFSRGFARGKLAGDPVYAGVLLGGVLPSEGLLVDLGCGRGLLLAVIAASPSQLRLLGVERRPAAARSARRALGARAEVVEADVSAFEIPSCSGVALIDVLHYLDARAQDALLARAAAALQPGGVVIVREADADGGLGFLAVRAAERLASIARGAPSQRFAYRARRAWIAALEALGLEVRAETMRAGTPFANDLIVARRARTGEAR